MKRTEPLFAINERVILEGVEMIVISRFTDVKTGEWMYVLALLGMPVEESRLTKKKA